MLAAATHADWIDACCVPARCPRATLALAAPTLVRQTQWQIRLGFLKRQSSSMLLAVEFLLSRKHRIALPGNRISCPLSFIVISWTVIKSGSSPDQVGGSLHGLQVIHKGRKQNSRGIVCRGHDTRWSPANASDTSARVVCRRRGWGTTPCRGCRCSGRGRG